MLQSAEKITQFFSGLSFEEGKHLYKYKGKTVPISVSGFLKNFYPQFDAQEASKRKEEKTGIPAQTYLREWKEINTEAVTRGSRVHAFAECYAINRKLKPECLQEEAVVKFFDKLPDFIVLVACELRVCMLDGSCAGTMDLLFYDTRHNYYIIADFKTNGKNLTKNFAGQRMFFPFEDLLDTPFNHYQIQLSSYQIMFEQTGLKVGRRVLVELGTDGEYRMYNLEDYTSRLKAYMN
jgi:hypothetical protein